MDVGGRIGSVVRWMMASISMASLADGSLTEKVAGVGVGPSKWRLLFCSKKIAQVQASFLVSSSNKEGFRSCWSCGCRQSVKVSRASSSHSGFSFGNWLMLVPKSTWNSFSG